MGAFPTVLSVKKDLVNLHPVKRAWPEYCWQPNELHNMAEASFFQDQARQGYRCKEAKKIRATKHAPKFMRYVRVPNGAVGPV